MINKHLTMAQFRLRVRAYDLVVLGFAQPLPSLLRCGEVFNRLHEHSIMKTERQGHMRVCRSE